MGIIAIPSAGPKDWQRVLTKPDLHWRSGASAMTLAACWEAARGGFPPEVRRVLDATGSPGLVGLEPLFIIPEYPVALPGGARPSMTDAFVLASGVGGLVAIAVEGKVNEPFGPFVGEKRQEASDGQLERLRFLQEKLGLGDVPDDVRYQLLHRSVSAILTAEQFGATSAVMLIHSFSREKKWLDDFVRFGELLGVAAQPDQVCAVPGFTRPSFHIGWCCGNLTFASVDLREDDHR